MRNAIEVIETHFAQRKHDLLRNQFGGGPKVEEASKVIPKVFGSAVVRSNAVGEVRVKGEIMRLERNGEIKGFLREITSLLKKKY